MLCVDTWLAWPISIYHPILFLIKTKKHFLTNVQNKTHTRKEGSIHNLESSTLQSCLWFSILVSLIFFKWVKLWKIGSSSWIVKCSTFNWNHINYGLESALIGKIHGQSIIYALIKLLKYKLDDPPSPTRRIYCIPLNPQELDIQQEATWKFHHCGNKHFSNEGFWVRQIQIQYKIKKSHLHRTN
jgi:hypothetical protein